MSEHSNVLVSRRNILRIFAATTVVAAPTYANAFGLMRRAGDVRRIRMYSGQSGEAVDTVYWVDGEYIPDAFHEISHFMRDWRHNEVKAVDPRTIDIATAAHRLMDTDEPYTMLSGYRNPATNAWLSRHMKGVAKHSLHMKAEAVDLRLKSRSVAQMSRAAKACRSGGVGTYTHSNFVHMDCGPVRTWGA